MAGKLPFELLFEAAPDAILITEIPSGTLVLANACASSLLGYSKEELQGRRLTDLIVTDDRNLKEAHAAVELLPAQVWRGELCFTNRQDEVLLCKTAATAVEFPGGRVVHWCLRDETAAGIGQLRARNTEKIEALSRFSGRVALEFEEVLTSVSTPPVTLPMLRTGPQAGPKDANAAWRKASWLLSQLGAFGRLQAQQLQPVEINACLAPLEDLLRQESGRFVHTRFILGESPALIHADPGQIKQILLKLCRNAGEAMARTGTLTVETSTEEVPAVMAQQLGVVSGVYVCIDISDTGRGFDEKIWTHLFEPFFTTKTAESDHGLDLSAVHGLVKQNGGVIWVTNGPSGGTTIRLLFPAIKNEPEVEPAHPLPPPAQKGSETVLVMDERDGIRTLVSNVLRRKGYSVLEAAQAGDALELCRSHDGPIHLMLAHLSSPQNIRDFREPFSQVRPELRFLSLLGTVDGISEPEGSSLPSAFLQEPFQFDELLPKVREVLDSSLQPRHHSTTATS